MDPYLLLDVAASTYLGPGAASFWYWSDGDEAVAWRGSGRTIAFRGELFEVLVAVHEHGLPDLSPLIMLLAATRSGWEQAADEAFTQLLADALSSVPRVLGAARPAQPVPPPRVVRQLERLWQELRPRLAAVGDLPAELRQGTAAKALLASTVLGVEFPEILPEQAPGVLKAIQAGCPPAEPLGGVDEYSVRELVADLTRLNRGLQLCSDTLEQQLRTGLGVLPAPAEVEVPPPLPSEEARALLESLRADPELGGLARLTRSLLACVSLPRGLTTSAQAPLGGVADLSNRGTLDRLLLSELAQDELTFVVRVAMGEALYLQREPPRTPPARSRLILLDNGIRLWGRARVFAVAVGLALVAEQAGSTATQPHDVTIVTPGPERLEAAELTTREGLEAQLGRLSSAPHPGQLLGELAERARLAGANAGPADVVIVTHRDAAADPEFVRALDADGPQACFLATVADDGRYALERRSERGRRELAQARLDLVSLLRPPEAASPAEPTESVGPSPLPLLLGLERLPLLLPQPIHPDRARFVAGQGVVQVTRSGRRLLWRQSPQRGAQELARGLPAGDVVWLEVRDDEVRALLHETHKRPVLVTVDAARGQAVHLVLERRQSEISGAFRRGRSLVMVSGRSIHAVDLADGSQPRPRQWDPELEFSGGTVFRRRDGSQWLTVIAPPDGHRLEPLPCPELHPRLAAVQEVFEGGRSLGCFGVERIPEEESGRLWWLRPGAPVDLGVPVSVPGGPRLRLESDGPRLYVGDRHTQRGAIYTIRRGELAGGPGRQVDKFDLVLRPELLDGLLRPWLAEHTHRQPALRRRFRALGIDPQGRLALVSRRGQVSSVALEPDGQSLRLVSQDLDPELLRQRRPLERVPGRQTPAGLSLRWARWRDGSRAFLDSRGLLHLCPPAEAGRELTLALVHDGPLAAWTGFGVLSGLHGPSFFVPPGPGEDRRLPAERVHRELERVLERWR